MTIEHDLSPQGIIELAKKPIRATLSGLDFPNITIELQHHDDDGSPFYNGILWLGDGVNPLIEHNTGKEITLEMMTKENRKKVDLLFVEKRMKEGKA